MDTDSSVVMLLSGRSMCRPGLCRQATVFLARQGRKRTTDHRSAFTTMQTIRYEGSRRVGGV